MLTERRLPPTQATVTNHTEKRITTEKVLSSLAHEAARETIGVRRPSNSASNSPTVAMFNSTPAPSLTYSLGMYSLLPNLLATVEHHSSGH